MTEQKILEAMQDAEAKAWEALSGYKFWMFGYHAGRWVNYNRLLSAQRPNPFREAVLLGRKKVDECTVGASESGTPSDTDRW